MKIPNDAYLIIIGAMKSGTTSLFHYLSAHPNICPSVVKEPEFFSQNQGHKLQGIRNYEDLWNFDRSRHIYAMEASTGYTKYPSEKDVPKRMVEYGIQPKLIYIMRNPFERILSQHNHRRRLGRKKDTSLDEISIYYSNYYLQLQQYAPCFSKDEILLLDYDELKNNPKKLLDRVYNFLSLPPHYPEKFEYKNVTPPYTELQVRIRGMKLQRFVPKMIRPFVARGVKKALDSVFPDATKKELTKKERETIYKNLRSDMILLHQEYGVDVKKWGFF